MNYRVIISLLGVSLVLTSCASSSNYSKNSSYSPPSLENDMAYVHAVEAAAKRSGVGVFWVHPPRKDMQSGIPQ